MDRHPNRDRPIAPVVALQLLLVSLAAADSQRIIEYDYDGAGNITGVRSELNEGPPDVTEIKPVFVGRESTIAMVATGSNLARASVATAVPGLTISNVSPASTQVRFFVTADETAVIGPAPLTFSTRFGSDVEEILVTERVPIVSTEPSPILLLPDGQAIDVFMVFDRPFETNQTYQLAMRDPAIATVSQATVTLPAGEITATVQVSGLSVGNTDLDITQPANFLAIAIPVIVVDPFQLPAGDLFIGSRPLGVVRNADEAPSGLLTALSPPLGVVTNLPDLPTGAGPSIALSPPLGVVLNQFASIGDLPPGDVQIHSDGLGVSLPPVAVQVAPASLPGDTRETLTITGAGLDLVTDVGFIPEDGISQTQPFVVTPDGTVLSLFIEVTAGAPPGLRQILLLTIDGPVGFSGPNGNLLEITD